MSDLINFVIMLCKSNTNFSKRQSRASDKGWTVVIFSTKTLFRFDEGGNFLNTSIIIELEL